MIAMPDGSSTQNGRRCYSFEIVCGTDRLSHPADVELRSDQEAFEYSVEVLRGLLQTREGRQLDRCRFGMRVADDGGRRLFTVPMSLPILQEPAI